MTCSGLQWAAAASCEVALLWSRTAGESNCSGVELLWSQTAMTCCGLLWSRTAGESNCCGLQWSRTAVESNWCGVGLLCPAAGRGTAHVGSAVRCGLTAEAGADAALREACTEAARKTARSGTRVRKPRAAATDSGAALASVLAATLVGAQAGVPGGAHKGRAVVAVQLAPLARPARLCRRRVFCLFVRREVGSGHSGAT